MRPIFVCQNMVPFGSSLCPDVTDNVLSFFKIMTHIKETMKPQHPALQELHSIILTKDWTEFCPEKTRAELLAAWVESWIVEAGYSQAVVSTKFLSSEYDDIIKTRLAQSMAEDLSETCAIYKTEGNKISAEMIAIRRKAKDV